MIYISGVIIQGISPYLADIGVISIFISVVSMLLGLYNKAFTKGKLEL